MQRHTRDPRRETHTPLSLSPHTRLTRLKRLGASKAIDEDIVVLFPEVHVALLKKMRSNIANLQRSFVICEKGFQALDYDEPLNPAVWVGHQMGRRFARLHVCLLVILGTANGALKCLRRHTRLAQKHIEARGILHTHTSVSKQSWWDRVRSTHTSAGVGLDGGGG